MNQKRKKSSSKKRLRKSVVVLALCLTALVGTAGSYAYLKAATGRVQNQFSPATLSHETKEDFDDFVKQNVKFTNTGTAPVVFRAKLVISWIDKDGVVQNQQPVKDTDYSLTLGSGWTQLDDYYYYNQVVKPKDSTTDLIVEAKQLQPGPNESTLSIDVLSQSIQAYPADAATEAWGVSIDQITGSGNGGNNG